MNSREEADVKLGFSGRVASWFLTSEITPLLALLGLLAGVYAILMTPREEDPQVDVTFARIIIPFPGASAREVEAAVSSRAEQTLAEVEGVEHIQSVSRPGLSLLTVQFKDGEKRQDAIVRLYNAIYSHQDWLPQNLGIGTPLIKPKGVDDVPIVSLALWSKDQHIGAFELSRIAHALEIEIQRVPGTRDVETLGASDRIVRVRLDPQKLSGYGLDIASLRQSLSAANASSDTGSLSLDNREIQVQAGKFLTEPEEISGLVVGVRNGAPIFLDDVAEVQLGTDQPKHYARMGISPAGERAGIGPAGQYPTVTVSVSKKPGTNAVNIAEQVVQRAESLRGIVIPADVEFTVIRNSGKTAEDKVQTLIEKLIFATVSVVVLTLVATGWRSAMVVGAAVVVTLMLTLFACRAWGYTFNRASLFGLIFSIGILVDDAIVLVENIHRHMQRGGRSLTDTIPVAVNEVGGPTILATFTVIAALLPASFVHGGLARPYMAPIPIVASIGMAISLVVALVFTPWMYRRVFLTLKTMPASAPQLGDDRLLGLFRRTMTPFLNASVGRRRRIGLLLTLVLLMGASLGLVAVRLVVIRMLPLDNKSEFQVVVDMPAGTTLEQTEAILNALGRQISTVPEVVNWQSYAGTSGPNDFTGLLRQYDLRTESYMGMIQVGLLDKHVRKRKSHEVALAIRPMLQAIAIPLGANVKVVEVPPGPPLVASLVAEIYGLNYEGQIEVAQQVRKVFESTQDIVDVDDTVEATQRKWMVHIDQTRAVELGVGQTAVTDALATVLQGSDVTFLHNEYSRYPVPVRLEFAAGDKSNLDTLKSLRVRSTSGSLIPISELANFEPASRDSAIYHKDLLPVVLVTGEMAGKLDSPLYGMAAIASKLAHMPIKDGPPIEMFLTHQPALPVNWSLKWDGEWQVTYEMFRDLGVAYAVGLVAIYLLIVIQFRSYLVPLIIMAPIPLTIIGVLAGHAFLGRHFTATSLMGVIALAGILVRNSILLVDFIQKDVKQGQELQEAVLRAGSVRAKPIVLTALAAMVGALFILDDPGYGGLAISIIFGTSVSTLLTLFVIPVLYYAFSYSNRS